MRSTILKSGIFRRIVRKPNLSIQATQLLAEKTVLAFKPIDP
jgi:hypothetical protein